MIEKLRAVFDTNVIIAAFRSRNPRSPTVELLNRWQANEFTLIYCDDLLLEYQSKFIAHKINFETRTIFGRHLRTYGEYVYLTPDQIQPIVSADPDDDIVIACAVVGQATHLVTYDTHLQQLGEIYQNIKILDGLHFLYALRGDTTS